MHMYTDKNTTVFIINQTKKKLFPSLFKKCTRIVSFPRGISNHALSIAFPMQRQHHAHHHRHRHRHHGLLYSHYNSLLFLPSVFRFLFIYSFTKDSRHTCAFPTRLTFSLELEQQHSPAAATQSSLVWFRLVGLSSLC